MNAPERIYLDGDVEVGDGVFPRCFENPKYASEPPVEYIRADLVDLLSDPRVKATEERLAFVLWKAGADRAAPNVGRNRTQEAFAEQLPETRERWLGLARAALRAIEEGQ